MRAAWADRLDAWLHKLRGHGWGWLVVAVLILVSALVYWRDPISELLLPDPRMNRQLELAQSQATRSLEILLGRYPAAEIEAQAAFAALPLYAVAAAFLLPPGQGGTPVIYALSLLCQTRRHGGG